MATINSGNALLNRCPVVGGFGYAKAVTTANYAVLTAEEPCRFMYFQAAVSNTSAVWIGMNAAASVVRFELPRAVGSGDSTGWFVIPCPCTTVPTFFSQIDSQTVYCMWVK